jgi:hypothetical protein
LYPKLAVGGFCIIDDYGLETCKKALDDYRIAHGISTPLVTIDSCAVYWKKDERG